MLEALTHDVTYYENQVVVPTCNHFNASLPKQEKFVITCRPDEKGCLKGWLTQVKLKALKYLNSYFKLYVCLSIRLFLSVHENMILVLFSPTFLVLNLQKNVSCSNFMNNDTNKVLNKLRPHI